MEQTPEELHREERQAWEDWKRIAEAERIAQKRWLGLAHALADQTAARLAAPIRPPKVP